jgi:hypothetical protein
MNLDKLPLPAAQKTLDAVNLVLATPSIDPSLLFQAAQLYTPLVDYIETRGFADDLRVRQGLPRLP